MKSWVCLSLGFVAVLLGTAPSATGYQEPIPEILYRVSANQQHMVQVIPMLDTTDALSDGIERRAPIVIVFERTVTEIKGVDEPIVMWEERALFRPEHRYNAHDGLAEVRDALITNGGDRIILRAAQHPMGDRSIPELFVYDQNGNQLAGFAPEDFFTRETPFILDGVAIDERERQLHVTSLEGTTRLIDLQRGDLLSVP